MREGCRLFFWPQHCSVYSKAPPGGDAAVFTNIWTELNPVEPKVKLKLKFSLLGNHYVQYILCVLPFVLIWPKLLLLPKIRN